MASSDIRIVIVEPNKLFAESLMVALGLEGYLATHVSRAVIGAGAQALLAAVLELRPQAVLSDLDLVSPGDGVLLIEALSQARVPTIVMTSSTHQHRWGEAIAHGASRVLPKSSPLTEIAATLRRIFQGLPVLSVTERFSLLQSWQLEQQGLRDSEARLATLTPREREVLGHFVRGRQVKEIADIRGVSEATVRTQTKAILAKLEVSSQIGAVGVARRARWQPPDA